MFLEFRWYFGKGLFDIAGVGGVFFDDFGYADQEAMNAHGWKVRDGAGWPGVTGGEKLDADQADFAFDAIFDRWWRNRLDKPVSSPRDSVASIARRDPTGAEDLLRSFAPKPLRVNGSRAIIQMEAAAIRQHVMALRSRKEPVPQRDRIVHVEELCIGVA